MPKVLIVDDSPIVTKMLDATLSRHGFEVCISHSPFGVSNKIREFKPDVLLMDLGLPGLSGEKLLNMCQEIGFNGYKIIISSAAESELKAHVSKGLAEDYYIKGSPIDKLVEKMLNQVKHAPVALPSPIMAEPPTGSGRPDEPGGAILAWRKNLEIGVEEIDSQHKELFKRFNDLLKACSDGKGREEICGYMAFLQTYIDTHFADEERLQVRYAYPGYEEHRQEHKQFTADLARLQEFLKQDGSGLSLVIETNKVSISWLLKHISGSDRALGDFLRGKI